MWAQVDNIQRICDAGWSVDALTCTDAEHAQAGYWSFPEQFAFMEAAIAGELTDPRCTLPKPARCEGQP